VGYLSRPLDTEPATLYERFLAWEGLDGETAAVTGKAKRSRGGLSPSVRIFRVARRPGLRNRLDLRGLPPAVQVF